MTSGPWAWTQASAFLKASKTLLLVAVVESRGSKTVVLSELGAGRGGGFDAPSQVRAYLKRSADIFSGHSAGGRGR